ncbi:hypothetical protein [Paenirhodobacter sp.]|uniref:hypothetical protein n=1 Tax=Paenirhodobacter sp. TaxID=1965326 RepID=UPI003B3D0700
MTGIEREGLDLAAVTLLWFGRTAALDAWGLFDGPDRPQTSRHSGQWDQTPAIAHHGILMASQELAPEQA